MPTVKHRLFIDAQVNDVYHAISTPEGLDAWWTLQCVGHPELNAHYRLYFGPGYDWKAEVTRCSPHEFQMKIYADDADWNQTTVGFTLHASGNKTEVEFSHEGWEDDNEHYRHSSYCWALYLRLLKRYVEKGEVMPYARRND